MITIQQPTPDQEQKISVIADSVKACPVCGSYRDYQHYPAKTALMIAFNEHADGIRQFEKWYCAECDTQTLERVGA